MEMESGLKCIGCLQPTVSFKPRERLFPSDSPVLGPWYGQTDLVLVCQVKMPLATSLHEPSRIGISIHTARLLTHIKEMPV